MRTILNIIVASVCMLTDYTHILVIGIAVLIAINIKLK
jgi:hypothetical protein